MISRIIKGIFYKPGVSPCKILFGPARGLSFNFDPYNNLQTIFGLYEMEIARYFKKYIASAKSFIDIGTSFGYYSLSAAKASVDTKIIACECRAEANQEFIDNLHLNKFHSPSRITYHNRFIGKDDLTLAELTANLPEPFFLKIDVEGNELEVLESGTDALKARRFSLIIETHSQDLETKCKTHLDSIGYDTKIIANAWWRSLIHDTRPLEQNRWLVASNIK